MNEKIKDYVLKQYPTRFKKGEPIIVEERENQGRKMVAYPSPLL